MPSSLNNFYQKGTYIMPVHSTVIFANYCFALLHIFGDFLSPNLPVTQNNDWSKEEVSGLASFTTGPYSRGGSSIYGS